MENKINKPTVSKSQFIEDVNNGMSKTELVAKWGISKASVKQLATQFGLTIQRAVTPKFILVDDVVDVTTKSTTFEYTSALNN